MPIIEYSDGDKETFRARVLDGIRRKKAENPDYTVIDIGGRHNPWADEVVDAYVDVFPFMTEKTLYTGDINNEDVWRLIETDGPYDFAIVSHVFEDIRDCITGLNWLPRVAKSGFLGLPVKHRELVHWRSPYWLGQSHHCWIFGVKGDIYGDPLLIAVPKWHCINYFNPSIPDLPPIDDEAANLGPRTLDWFDPTKSGHELELGVIWETDLPFWTPEYVMMIPEQIEILRTEFRDGV
jgi:hypothetical protein